MANKNHVKLGVAAAAAVAAGATAIVSKNKKQARKKEVAERVSNFRNTERGRYERNSKGIYYSNGNYEAFARPLKPEGVDEKSAYIVGSGLGALAAACFLVRDGQMKGERIHVTESLTRREATSCAAGARWKTISSVCGICSEAFPQSRHRVCLC